MAEGRPGGADKVWQTSRETDHPHHLLQCTVPGGRRVPMMTAYLELRETVPDTSDILWKVPHGGDKVAVYRALPPDAQRPARAGVFCERGSALAVRRAPATAGAGHEYRRPCGRRRRCTGSLEHANGSTHAASCGVCLSSLLKPCQGNSGGRDVLTSAWGATWRGIDHLSYILAMLLLVKGLKRIVATMMSLRSGHAQPHPERPHRLGSCRGERVKPASLSGVCSWRLEFFRAQAARGWRKLA